MTITKKINHFDFSPSINSGESLFLLSSINSFNGKEFHLTQELTLSSYGQEAVLKLRDSALTPIKLRELANHLETALKNEGLLPIEDGEGIFHSLKTIENGKLEYALE